MRSIQTQYTVPLASVKPLERLAAYRDFCLATTRQALQGRWQQRTHSPVTGSALVPAGEVEGLPYLRCPDTGSLFLAQLPDHEVWAGVLEQISRHRHSPDAFHSGLVQSRLDNVYAPKQSWIQDTLRLQGLHEPRILEAVTPPSDFTSLLKESRQFAQVITVNEMDLVASEQPATGQRAEAAVLLESLDRVDDPAALVRAVANRLPAGGLLFLTALVVSGFDMAVLGLRNRYFYPPDRTNGFSLKGLSMLLARSGFTLLELSTPGVLDVEIVQAHLQQEPGLALSAFERQVMEADQDTRQAFQTFLQQWGFSSFTRIVARKQP